MRRRGLENLVATGRIEGRVRAEGAPEIEVSG